MLHCSLSQKSAFFYDKIGSLFRKQYDMYTWEKQIAADLVWTKGSDFTAEGMRLWTATGHPGCVFVSLYMCFNIQIAYISTNRRAGFPLQMQSLGVSGLNLHCHDKMGEGKEAGGPGVSYKQSVCSDQMSSWDGNQTFHSNSIHQIPEQLSGHGFGVLLTGVGFEPVTCKREMLFAVAQCMCSSA